MNGVLFATVNRIISKRTVVVAAANSTSSAWTTFLLLQQQLHRSNNNVQFCSSSSSNNTMYKRHSSTSLCRFKVRKEKWCVVFVYWRWLNIDGRSSCVDVFVLQNGVAM